MAFALSRKSLPFFKALSLIVISVLSIALWQRHPERHPRPDYRVPQQYSDDLPACSAIILGDIDGKKEELRRLLSSSRRRELLSEEFYLNETRDCDAFVDSRGFITTPLSVEERDFPIAFSMVIHEKIEMFERLLRAVYRPQNIYCVHVDQKSSEDFQKAVRAIVSCFPNVFVASRLERVVYASWSRVQADLNCMKDLSASHVPWRYLINTCGSDFPIKTNAEMVRALTLLNGRNSMESEATVDYKKLRWQYRYNVTDTGVIRTGVRKSPPPVSTPMFAGSAYFVATRNFVGHLLRGEDTEVRAFLEWERDTYSPDEHLWATLQRMPSVPGSKPANVKYGESDMNAIARLVKWSYLAGDVSRGAPYQPCFGSYRRAVCVYGGGDLRWLFQHHQLMANKFDPTVDDTAIRCIESLLYFKAMRGKLSTNEPYHSILQRL